MSEVTIGRNPSCHVRFPKDLAVVSRLHARIVRDGNRFKVIDQSANGTYLNGKVVTEAYLREGDVLMFAEGGPKVSFLTQTAAPGAGAVAVETTPTPEPSAGAIPSAPEMFQAPDVPSPHQKPPVRTPAADVVSPQPVAESGYRSPAVSPPPVQPPPPQSPSMPAAPQQGPVQRVKKPLFIQYGPTLRSFNELPVTIGQGPQCDFVINHPAIFERHAQVFCHGDQYWIKDLSGKNPLRINGLPVEQEGMLEPDCSLSLSPQGPDFRFLGDGRLAEIESSPEEIPAQTPDEGIPRQQRGLPSANGLKEIGGVVKRFFKK